MSESKREKFIRLAENRVNNTLKQIQLIGNLSNKASYDYTKEDVEMVIRALKGAVSDVEKLFKCETSSGRFTLRK